MLCSPVPLADGAGVDVLHFTGRSAAIWTDVLHRTVAYSGDDTAAFERNLG
ncbi:hypothetical protein FHS87_002402 [Roseomonas pecuniae]|uniref:Uncharacterized protein n=1 Tax=Muricoccus pecuniae TaxID=693023 RepID=A0A840Y2I5_9PROT|nr:hypothetical protein [Roseomonas pecuniae]